jgi:tetratricopeptide (TPR) repeat protein
LSRCGDTERATALVDELNRSLPSSTPFQNFWLPAIRASMALSRSEAAAAIDVLNPALRYELGVPEPDSHISGTLYPAYVRGDAYLKAGRAREAAAEFQKLIDHRGVALNFVLGALAHLQLGRAKAQSGDLIGARQAYDRFLALWKDADPDVPILKSARTEYARLQ